MSFFCEGEELGSDHGYRQCTLEKARSTGSVLKQTSFIPEPFCKVGLVLKLKEDTGWENGWKVVWAGEALVPEHRLMDYSSFLMKFHKHVAACKMKK